MGWHLPFCVLQKSPTGHCAFVSHSVHLVAPHTDCPQDVRMIAGHTPEPLLGQNAWDVAVFVATSHDAARHCVVWPGTAH
jgi:hypothetical protein